MQNSNEEKRLLHEQIKILKQKLVNISNSNNPNTHNKNDNNSEILLQNEIEELKKSNNHLKSENEKMTKQIKLFEKQ